MTIAIAEDAVSPGNVAVSQNFTVNARAATITFASGESGGREYRVRRIRHRLTDPN